MLLGFRASDFIELILTVVFVALAMWREWRAAPRTPADEPGAD